MRIAVLGATGGVGAHVTRLALEQGHHVIAIARDITKIQAKGNHLETATLDLASDDGTQLEGLIKGSDLVLSCLGSKRGEPKVVEKGTAALLKAMSASKVNRMAIISSIGVGDSSIQLLRLGVGGWIFSALFATVLRGVKYDLQAAEDLCIGNPGGYIFGQPKGHARPSGVSCVVVRPAGLSDAPGDGAYDVALASGTVGASVAREDVARFMLTLAGEEKYDNGAVSVGGHAPRTGH
jgi:uncharacterized protein YbjT (DUF2867 family)